MHSEIVEIRRAGLKDVEQIQVVARQTFSETFTAYNSENNMRTYLDLNFTHDRLYAELSHMESQFYIACLRDRVIAYLKINMGQAQSEIKDAEGMEIERIYVLNEFQGKQVGQLLYHKALEIAKQKGMKYLWLGVWEKNHRAIQFYRKNGFVEFGTHLFMLADEAQNDLMMRLELQ